MGAAYKKKKEATKAIESYKKAIAVKANHFESLRNLGNIYRSKEQFTKAIDYYQRALKIKPKDYKTAYNRAVAIQSNDPEGYDAAITAWEEFLKVGQKSPKARKQVENAKNIIKQLIEARDVNE